MSASRYEQEFAQTSGVSISHWAQPRRLEVDGRVTGIEFERTELDDAGKLRGTGETWSLDADVVFKAVGQVLGDDVADDGPGLHRGRFKVDESRRTSLPDVWAGGDCVHGNDDLTVSAVQDGKVAAHSIDQYLRQS